MRPFLVLLVLCAVGCGSYDVCGPSTCDGCCSSSGECLSGTADTACGAQGNVCVDCGGAGMACLGNICRGTTGGGLDAGFDAGETDAGVDAGAVDAGRDVTVQMIYEREEFDAGVCPVYAKLVHCSESATVSDGRLAELQAAYADCEFTAFDGGAIYRFTCSNCGEAMSAGTCATDAGETLNYSTRNCTFPLYTVEDFCAWQVPF